MIKSKAEYVFSDPTKGLEVPILPGGNGLIIGLSGSLSYGELLSKRYPDQKKNLD